MQSANSDEELLRKLKTHRKNILLTLHENGELATNNLRESAGFPAGSKNHHFAVLQDWELIEIVGRVGHENERVIGLTAQGQSFVEEYLVQDTPHSIEASVDRLHQRVDELESELAQERETRREMERELEGRFEKLKQYVAENVKQ